MLYLTSYIMCCKSHLQVGYKEKETFHSEKGRQLPDEFVSFFVSIFKLGKVLLLLSSTYSSSTSFGNFFFKDLANSVSFFLVSVPKYLGTKLFCSFLFKFYVLFEKCSLHKKSMSPFRIS